MTLRAGLIGCGDIGRLRASALARSGWRLVAVSDLDRARAEDVARPAGATVEQDWHSLVRRADLDAVIVSTPPSLHAAMCIEAFAHGKHVLCEKPLARTPAECASIVAAATAAGRVLGTGFNFRFYPSVKKARAIVDSGLIGALDHIQSYTGYSAAEHTHAWMRDPETMGGGALRDNGIHLIDLTRYFLGEPVSVEGHATSHGWGFPGVEDNGFVLMRNSDGNVATLQASWTERRGFRFAIDIIGTLGSVRLSCYPMITDVAWSTTPGGPVRRRRHLFPYTFLMEHLRTYRWVVVQSLIEELDAFAQAIGGQPITVLATANDGLRAVEIADAAAHAAAKT